MYQMQELNVLVFLKFNISYIAGRAALLALVLRGVKAFCFIGFKRRALYKRDSFLYNINDL